MKIIKYFFQFLILIILFTFFRLLGLNLSRCLSGYLLTFFGPLFRSKKIIFSNLSTAFPKMKDSEKKQILKRMWFNYGKILAEYVYIKKFSKDSNYSKNIIIENQAELDLIKQGSDPVIFVSGHFNNFELMAMQIEKLGINLAAVYRPLNNIFLNPIMENIRRKYICKNQIKKGINGVREAIEFIKNNHSVALMVDQRVSEGEKIDFFKKPALTTTLPAQLSIKYNLKIIPVYIERAKNNNFKIEFQKEIDPKKFKNKIELTKELNTIMEKMIERNPTQWIWSHNRWK